MKNSMRIAMAGAAMTAAGAALADPGTAFTYQGDLRNTGTPAAGPHDFQFRLFDAATGGVQAGSVLCADNVTVVNGVFTISLDFGDQFSPGDPRFLEISVRADTGLTCATSTSFTTLTTRQALSITPFAGYATAASVALNANNTSQLNGQASSFYLTRSNHTGLLPTSGLGGTYASPVTFSNASSSFTGSGAGLTALNATNVASGTLAEARLPATTARTNAANTFTLGQTFSSTVTMQNLLRFTGASFDINANSTTRLLHVDTFTSDPPNIIAGAPTNSTLGAEIVGATIAGGGQLDSIDPATANVVTDAGGTISGGAGNRAGDLAGTATDAMFATVGGGERNRAMGDRSTVAGGSFNGGTGDFGFVGGGQSNLIGGAHAVIGGGNTNEALGTAAAVLGGESNSANSNYATIAGGLNNGATTKGFVGGGENNSAGGTGFAVVAGGLNNTASGLHSAIPGGELNQATGGRSFAAGFQAGALHNGAFVWGDSTNAPFNSTDVNQFLIRAIGGVGINTNDPVGTLHVRSSAVAVTPSTSSTLVLERNSNNILTMLGSDAGERAIVFGSVAVPAGGTIAYQNASGMIFRTGGVIDRAIIENTGDVGIGDQTPDARLDVETVSATVAAFNRTGTDGVVVEIQQAGVVEGSIAVVGTTVSFNAFTGSHFAWTDERILRGELVSFTGVNKNYHDRAESEPLYGVRRTVVANDPAVLGAYLAVLEPSQSAGSENPHQIMAVGNGDMWIVDTGTAIRPGDSLISSDVPGCAMKDDEERFATGYVIARAAESIDWNRVQPGPDGRKRVRASVLFGAFVRTGEARLRVLEERLAELERLLGR